MFEFRLKSRQGIWLGLMAGLLLWAGSCLPALAQDPVASGKPAMLAQLKAAGVRSVRHRQLDSANFIGVGRRPSLTAPGITPGAAPTFNAMVLAEKYGPLFGLSQARDELLVERSGANGARGGMVRYQQVQRGVPVLGGEMVVNMDRGGGLLSMNGEIGALPKGMALEPVVTAEQARVTALTAVAKWYGLGVGDLQCAAPLLALYDPRLLGPGNNGLVRLVWRLEVRPLQLAPIRELVLVDARRGGIALHFNQVDSAKNRTTYTANSTTDLVNQLLCTEAAGDVCTSGGATNTEANFAHLYAGATYDFYLLNHGRDSYDGQGGALISTVQFNDPAICPNAFWNGTQMVYCQGFPAADDVVAHELTHAVTERTSRLFYYYQSGAINESFSDLWGEFVDLTDGSGNDDPSVRWLLGEEINSPTTDPPMVGAIRDMAYPPAFHDPDRMKSDFYVTDASDSGGVHTNSGVNNKAVSLLTDGGTFNGRTVTALGIAKVAKIYYEVQTNLLTSGSDYLDLSNALAQGCDNLVGTAGITTSDCDQVRVATAAVEMDQEPAPDFNPEAEVCGAGQDVHPVFFDDMESGAGKWVTSSTTTTTNWQITTGYETSGSQMFWGIDADVTSDHRVAFANSVTVPGGQPYLHFRHAFEFESDPATPVYYDGGVLEYSSDNGSTWSDALSLYDSGKNYNTATVIHTGTGNPLAGRHGFVGASHGYVSTRLNLASLAGQNVKFRWRVGTDANTGALGWVLDDVQLYTCGNSTPIAEAGSAQNVARSAAVTLNGSASSDSDGSIVAYAWTQTGGTAVTLNNANSATPTFTAPTSLGSLTFQLTVTDNLGALATDTVTVTVINVQPVVSVGSAQTVLVNAAVTLDGSASSDPDGSIVSYAWTQTGGTAVTLDNAAGAIATFTAPATVSVLTFQLTATDNEGATGSAATTVTVKVQLLPPPAGGGGGGCSLSRDGEVDPTLFLVFWGALILIRLRRRA